MEVVQQMRITEVILLTAVKRKRVAMNDICDTCQIEDCEHCSLW